MKRHAQTVKKPKHKVYRIEYPRIRGRLVNGTEYFEIDLRRAGHVGKARENFSDLAKAKTRAAEIAAKVRIGGLSSLIDSRLAQWQATANIHGLDLVKVVDLGFEVAIERKKKEVSPVLNGLFDEWYKAKEKQIPHLAESSLKGCRSAMKRFKDDLGEKRVGEIDRPFAEDYLNKIEGSGSHKDFFRRHLLDFFNSTGKAYVTVNPVEGIPSFVTKNHLGPVYYDVERCKAIMREAMKTPQIVPYFALCLFCGVRPDGECERLEWFGEGVHSGGKWGIKLDGEKGYVMMPGSITKTGEPRQFWIPENCVAWLKAYKVDGKPLIPDNFTNASRAVRRAFNGSWVQDGMRHTFATYHYAKHKDLLLLEHMMGSAPEVIKRFYRGMIADNDVAAFWNITPESLKS